MLTRKLGVRNYSARALAGRPQAAPALACCVLAGGQHELGDNGDGSAWFLAPSMPLGELSFWGVQKLFLLTSAAPWWMRKRGSRSGQLK